MVLVDTSVWIEYLDRGNTAIEQDVEALLYLHEAAVSGMILAEIRQGCRKAGKVRSLMATFEPLAYIEADRGAWLRAGEITAEGATRGFALQIADCLIAALALREKCPVFTLDHDFERIPGIILYRPRLN